MSKQAYHKSDVVSIKLPDGQIVGKVVGETFYKNVRASKHFLRTPPAIAFDTSTLLQAQQAGALWCEVVDSETGKTYRASLHAVLQSGFSFNRGHGAQVAMPIAKWTTGGNTVGAQLTFSF